MADAPIAAAPTEVTAGEVPVGQIPFQGPDGQIYYIPEATANPDQLRAQGLVPIYGDALKAAQNQAVAGASPWKAAALGAANMATFDAAGQLLKRSGAVSGEEQGLLQQENPGSYLAGQAAGLIADPFSAVGTVAKTGEKIGAGVVERLAGKEATTFAEKVAQAAAEKGVGSAVEGAAFGAGHTLNENTIGDKELTAENLLHNVMDDAMFFGMFGAGLGATGAATSGILTKTNEALAARGIAPSQLYEKGVEKFQEWAQKSSELKPGAEEVIDIGKRHDLPVFAPQVSDSPIVKGMSHMAQNSETQAGEALREAQRGAVTKANDVIQRDALGVSPGSAAPSRYEVGTALAGSLEKNFREQADQISKIFDSQEGLYPAIPLRKPEIRTLQTRLMDLAKAEGPESSSIYKGLQGLSDYVGKMESVRDLRALEKTDSKFILNALGRENSAYAGQVRGMISDSILGTLKSELGVMKSPQARSVLQSLVDNADQVKKTFAQTAEKWRPLQDVLGVNAKGGKFGSTATKISQQDAENIVKRLLSTDTKIEKLKSLQKIIPEEMEQVRQLAKDELAFSSGKAGSGQAAEREFSNRKFFGKWDELSKEKRDWLFTPEEQKTVTEMRKYLGSMPDNVREPGEFRHVVHGAKDFAKGAAAYALGGPIGSAVSYFGGKHIERMAAESLLKSAEVGSRDASMQVYKKIEDTANRTRQIVTSTSKKIFDAGSAVTKTVSERAVPAASMVGRYRETQENKKKAIDTYQKRTSAILENTQDLSVMIDKIHNATVGLSEHAPETTEALQRQAMVAAAFLASKIQKPGMNSIMSPKAVPSMSEISKFNRYYDAVKTPTSVLYQIHEGSLTPEAVESVNTVYPKLSGEMKSELTNQMIAHLNKKMPDPIPYARKLSLSMFLGHNLVDSLEPKAIADMQATNLMASAKNDAAAMKPTQAGLASLGNSGRMMTDTQALQMKGDA